MYSEPVSRPASIALQGLDRGGLERKTHLLNSLQPTLNHDLPNMLVALQGMLDLLQTEEGDRLSSDGQEYLQRITAIVQKMNRTIVTVRSINKAQSCSSPAERIVLAEFVREVAGAMKECRSRVNVVFQSDFEVPVVTAPWSSLHQALIEMIKVLIGSRRSGDCHVYIATRRAAGGVELICGDSRAGSPGSPEHSAEQSAAVLSAFQQEVDYDAFGAAHRLSLILIDEIAGCWGGMLYPKLLPDSARVFYVTIPVEQERPAPKSKAITPT